MANEKVWITEYARATKDPRNTVPCVEEPEITTQVLDISGGASVQSAAFNAETQLIRVHTNSIAHTLVATNPTAVVATCKRSAANQTEYFGIPKEAAGTRKLAAILGTT